MHVLVFVGFDGFKNDCAEKRNYEQEVLLLSSRSNTNKARAIIPNLLEVL